MFQQFHSLYLNYYCKLIVVSRLPDPEWRAMSDGAFRGRQRTIAVFPAKNEASAGWMRRAIRIIDHDDAC